MFFRLVGVEAHLLCVQGLLWRHNYDSCMNCALQRMPDFMTSWLHTNGQCYYRLHTLFASCLSAFTLCWYSCPAEPKGKLVKSQTWKYQGILTSIEIPTSDRFRACSAFVSLCVQMKDLVAVFGSSGSSNHTISEPSVRAWKFLLRELK